MRTVVPLRGHDPKTRLVPFFDAGERRGFAVSILRDVLDVVRTVSGDPVVIADALMTADASVTVNDRPLTKVVGGKLDDLDDGPVAVVMTGLALAMPTALSRLFEIDVDVVAMPDLDGGVNVLVARHPELSVDRHGASILDRRRITRDVGCSFAKADSMRLAVDVDEPSDSVEVLTHGGRRVREWLVDASVRLACGSGRVEVIRERR